MEKILTVSIAAYNVYNYLNETLTPFLGGDFTAGLVRTKYSQNQVEAILANLGRYEIMGYGILRP